jgi:predicted AAA+ superfamily ATPase
MNRKDLFKELIVEFQSSSLPEVIKRDIEIPINTGKIISVIGVRRSGKTFILFQTIKELLKEIPIEKIIYINFEDERLDIKAKDLGLLLEAYKELYPEIELKEVYFFFDEIQNIDGWEKFVRRIYDNYSKNIFITSSNSKLLSKEIATALRGRTIKYEVYPLSFKEFLRFKKINFTERDFYSINKRAVLKKFFNEFLMYGGFPEVVFIEDKNIKIKILQEYYEVMLFKDIIERYNIKNIHILKYFIKRIVENISKPLSINNIYNELKSQGYKISKDSLYQYLDILEAVYFTILIKKFSKSILKSELSQKKAYLIDNGLVNALTFAFKENFGTLLENLTAKEFKNREYNIFYFKDKKECDFIIEKEGNFLPIQVSYTLLDNKTKEREIKGLLEAMNYLNLEKGMILTHEEEDLLKIGNKTIEIQPAYKYFLLNSN